MSRGRGQIYILIFLCLILYGVVFYNFIWSRALPEIETVNASIEVAQRKKEALDRDLANIENIKRSVNMKNVQNERLEEYLMSESDFSDSIEYIDKLDKLFENKLTDVNLDTPSEKTSKESGSKYYEFKIGFNASLTYKESMNLISYLEGGTRKVKITNFDFKPLIAARQSLQTPQAPQSSPNPQSVPNQQSSDSDSQLFSVGMTVNVYSLNLGSIDKMYEYSRQKFIRYNQGDGIIFVPDSKDSAPSGNTAVSKPNPNVSTNVNTGRNTGSGSVNVTKKYDFEVHVLTFFAPGQNFYAYDMNNKKAITYKTKDAVNMELNFAGDSYSFHAVDNLGKVREISGGIGSQNISMLVKSDFNVSVNEDKNLGANIKIKNDSGKSITITLSDNTRKIKITDRNGNVIYRRNDSERIYII